MELKLIIAIDDVNPKKGYRILGEHTETWLRQLNDEFGCKFTLFIPSNYHGQYPLTEHREWIQELNSIEWLELAAHGHLHMTNDSQKFGECEFFELQNVDEARKRVDLMYDEWVNSIDVFPVGWRNPGWLCSPESQRAIQYLPLQYAAIHYEHNRDMEWNCKTFFGHDGIQMENIWIHNGDMIMYQSHVAGSHNHNVWNQNNYEQLHLSLTHLYKTYGVVPKKLNECLI